MWRSGRDGWVYTATLAMLENNYQVALRDLARRQTTEQLEHTECTRSQLVATQIYNFAVDNAPYMPGGREWTPYHSMVGGAHENASAPLLAEKQRMLRALNVLVEDARVHVHKRLVIFSSLATTSTKFEYIAKSYRLACEFLLERAAERGTPLTLADLEADIEAHVEERRAWDEDEDEGEDEEKKKEKEKERKAASLRCPFGRWTPRQPPAPKPSGQGHTHYQWLLSAEEARERERASAQRRTRMEAGRKEWAEEQRAPSIVGEKRKRS